MTSREFCPARRRSPLPSSARSSECPSPCSPYDSHCRRGRPLSVGWTLAGLAGGLLLAFATQAGPVARLALGNERPGVAAEASRHQRSGTPWPLRAGLDIILIAGAAVSFALTARSGYQVVLAPEGIPQTQVNYAALVGQALAWPGLALLVWRVTAWTTGRRTGRWARGRSSGAPEFEAASLRQRRMIVARGAAGLAVALGLAASTAIFTATYDTQSRVDVALTVGSDVAVVEPPGAVVGPGAARQISGTPGVGAVEPLMHRFGYVGPDLQDLYGVDASTFGKGAVPPGRLRPREHDQQDARSAERHPGRRPALGRDAARLPVKSGDLIRIRLQTGKDRAYRPVTFHVLGQVTEWPTAPKDSFIVANSDYLARTTGSDAVGSFLISSGSPARTAATLRKELLASGSGATVQDISSAGSHVTSASGLAASDLGGLSRLELGFGVLLALACSALALAGGIVERRRALGAAGGTRGNLSPTRPLPCPARPAPC